MNIHDIKEKLNDIILNVDLNSTENEKIQYLNNEVNKLMEKLVQLNEVEDFHVVCDSSNQQNGDNITCDISVRLFEQTIFHFIQLKTKR